MIEIIGVIGGSGLYGMDGLEFVEELDIITEYGAPSDKYIHYTYMDRDLYFLSRHGRAHSIAPHMINYKANIDGFRQIGVNGIITFSSVGGIADGLKPGDIVLPDNGIDFTNGRNATYFNLGEIFHVDLTSPYCPELRKRLLKAAELAGIPVKDGGVSICVNGPRMETGAEVKMFKQWGADIIGMTSFPECTLAREMGICYVNASVVSNYAAGITGAPLTTVEIVGVMTKSAANMENILKQYVVAGRTADCYCARSRDETKISK